MTELRLDNSAVLQQQAAVAAAASVWSWATAKRNHRRPRCCIWMSWLCPRVAEQPNPSDFHHRPSLFRAWAKLRSWLQFLLRVRGANVEAHVSVDAASESSNKCRASTLIMLVRMRAHGGENTAAETCCWEPTRTCWERWKRWLGADAIVLAMKATWRCNRRRGWGGRRRPLG